VLKFIKINKFIPYREWWRDWPCETTATYINNFYVKVPNPAEIILRDKERKIKNKPLLVLRRGFLFF